MTTAGPLLLAAIAVVYARALWCEYIAPRWRFEFCRDTLGPIALPLAVKPIWVERIVRGFWLYVGPIRFGFLWRPRR